MLEVELLGHQLLQNGDIQHVAQVDPLLPHLLVHTLLLQLLHLCLGIGLHQLLDALSRLLGHFIDVG